MPPTPQESSVSPRAESADRFQRLPGLSRIENIRFLRLMAAGWDRLPSADRSWLMAAAEKVDAILGDGWLPGEVRGWSLRPDNSERKSGAEALPGASIPAERDHGR